MWRLSLVFFALSAIINADTTELAALHHNNNEEIMINEAEQIETDLVNTNANHINDVNEVEKARIRSEFTTKMCATLKKNINMTIDDKIEKRALNKVQINHILDVLVNDKKKVKGFYNFRDTYVFKEISGTKYLAS